MSNEVTQEILEQLVDEGSLSSVLSELAVVACVKADQLDSNWQDHDAATVWRRAGRQIDQLSASLATQAL